MTGVEYSYDDTRLQTLFNQLNEKQQAQALKGGFRKAANNFRKAAVRNLNTVSGGKNQKPLRSKYNQRDLETGIRALVFKRQLGFRVTVGTSGKRKGFHLTRHKNELGDYMLKPILMWAEEGTVQRWTKSNGGMHTRRFTRRKRSFHPTGKFGPYKFMAKTKEEQADNISAELQNEIRKNVRATAKRCGCTV